MHNTICTVQYAARKGSIVSNDNSVRKTYYHMEQHNMMRIPYWDFAKFSKRLVPKATNEVTNTAAVTSTDFVSSITSTLAIKAALHAV